MRVELTQTPDGRLWYQGEPAGCLAYFLCDNQAVTIYDFGAPVGPVPACQRCADRSDDLRDTPSINQYVARPLNGGQA